MTARATVFLFLALATLGAGAAARGDEPAKAVALGAKVADGDDVRDLRGNRRAISGFAGHKALVLVFLGTDCPVSDLYVPGLLELEKRLRPRGVQFLAVYPNEHED